MLDQGLQQLGAGRFPQKTVEIFGIPGPGFLQRPAQMFEVQGQLGPVPSSRPDARRQADRADRSIEPGIDGITSEVGQGVGSVVDNPATVPAARASGAIICGL